MAKNLEKPGKTDEMPGRRCRRQKEQENQTKRPTSIPNLQKSLDFLRIANETNRKT